VLTAWRVGEADGKSTMLALFDAIDQVLVEQSENLAIPRRFSSDMKEIWVLQARLLNRSGRRPFAILSNPRFRAAYDFLLLRCESGELDMEIADWWERFQRAGEEERKSMLVPGSGGRRKRRRRKSTKKPPKAEETPPVQE